MRTRNWNGSFDLSEDTNDAAVDELTTDRRQFRRSRSARPAKRRSSRATGTHPDVGIAGRRNRRWSW